MRLNGELGVPLDDNRPPISQIYKRFRSRPHQYSQVKWFIHRRSALVFGYSRIPNSPYG